MSTIIEHEVISDRTKRRFRIDTQVITPSTGELEWVMMGGSHDSELTKASVKSLRESGRTMRVVEIETRTVETVIEFGV